MDKRISKGAQTLKALQDSLAELMQETDFESITVDGICANCGVTKGAFYHHFNTKGDLLGLVIANQMNAFMVEAIAEAEETFSQDVPNQIVRWIAAIVRYAQENNARFAGYFLKGSPSERWSGSVSGWHDSVQARFVRWQKAGILRSDVSPVELHQYCDAFTYGMASLWTQTYICLPMSPNLIHDFVRTLLDPAFSAHYFFE